ncbi:hypothetical protein [Prochlorothrix hollandica]|uniref:hypothetical protein n=1 Tax=Prochlorothrix hollandica TaxID=1223 RepID=UPI0003475118|nr:hypothetical protein [Prochlorothrix hollandica]
MPLSDQERYQWQQTLAEANRHNVLCHCRQCDREWVSSAPEPCQCGSRSIEWILCWQFPDG